MVIRKIVSGEKAQETSKIFPRILFTFTRSLMFMLLAKN